MTSIMVILDTQAHCSTQGKKGLRNGESGRFARSKRASGAALPLLRIRKRFRERGLEAVGMDTGGCRRLDRARTESPASVGIWMQRQCSRLGLYTYNGCESRKVFKGGDSIQTPAAAANRVRGGVGDAFGDTAGE